MNSSLRWVNGVHGYVLEDPAAGLIFPANLAIVRTEYYPVSQRAVAYVHQPDGHTFNDWDLAERRELAERIVDAMQGLTGRPRTVTFENERLGMTMSADEASAPGGLRMYGDALESLLHRRFGHTLGRTHGRAVLVRLVPNEVLVPYRWEWRMEGDREVMIITLPGELETYGDNQAASGLLTATLSSLRHLITFASTWHKDDLHHVCVVPRESRLDHARRATPTIIAALIAGAQRAFYPPERPGFRIKFYDVSTTTPQEGAA